MPAGTIQLHALPEELLGIATWIVERFSCRIVVTEFPPRVSSVATLAELPRYFENPKVSAVACVLGERDAAQSTYSPEHAIMIQVARPTGGALRQSSIGVVTPIPEVMSAWRLTVKHVDANSHEGVILLARGGRKPRPGFRYTDGARKLADSGVKMLAFAGTVEYSFGAPTEKTGGEPSN